MPGPAAYGRGGTEATATDAMVNLGWLRPEAFLGGGMSLDGDLARKAFEDGPAAALGMSVEEASMGAVRILSHSMVQSIEENSVRKGFDPRDFALVAEGGAGPLFAVPIAIEVGTPTVVVPQYPGIAAAMGLVATDMVYEYGSTTYQRLSKLDALALQQRFEELETQAASQLREDGIEDDRSSSSGSSRPVTSGRVRAQGRRRLGHDRRRLGREAGPTSTTSTSASTRGGSRTRTSRFRTSASAVSA